MVKVDIYSGFLGAGKTSLIKKLVKEAYAGEKVVLIENEFGEIGIDGGFLKDAGIVINEMNSGCICCSLVGDFTKALANVISEYNPDRIIIEPSGVGKLSDVIKAVNQALNENAKLNSYCVVVDAGKCKMYMKNFGEFFNDQVENACAIILSHADVAKEGKIEEAVKLLREHNKDAVIITTPWSSLDGKEILKAIETGDTLDAELKEMEEEHHHHHDHEHFESCGCGHHHDHDHEHSESCGCGHHHDHDHEHSESCGCGHHHDHDHEHSETCSCGHHHDHHADEVFSSFGVETTKKFTEDEIRGVLEKFSEDNDCGMILRAKGILQSADGRWIHFDYVPGEPDIRYGSAAIIGRLCVIGTNLDKDKIKEIFGV